MRKAGPIRHSRRQPESRRAGSPASWLAPHRWARLAFCGLLACLVLPAQEPTAGEKTRPSGKIQDYNSPGAGNTYNPRGDYISKPQRADAVVTAVDLEKRSITVLPAKRGHKFKVAEVGAKGREWHKVDKMELTFMVPSGREQVKVSKKAAKTLGKKTLTLEELQVGSKTKVEYYPVLRQIVQITVEQPAS